MAFSELIRNFDKIRDYMRDFYIYGFKRRGEFAGKSARTYDNEKRRIESYLGQYIRWSHDRGGKRTFITLDSAAVPVNPLYAAWKSKSFTAKDIMLHFYILDALRDGEALGVEELTDWICRQSDVVFDPQTVRGKCREYAAEGVLLAEKRGKAICYRLSRSRPGPELLDLLRFYQGAAPFGEIGSFLLDGMGERNDRFRFGHHYVVHTLEDGVLLDILAAMGEERSIRFVNHSQRAAQEATLTGVPLKILASAVTGRRYVCIYHPLRRRFASYRLDYVKRVEPGEVYKEYEEIRDALDRNLDLVWGVSFGGRSRREILCMKLYIDEKTEPYVLERLEREGRGGEVLRLEENIFLYSKEVYDINEMSSWVKTFTGRIIALEGSNREVVERFYRDMNRMASLYGEVAD